MKTNAGGVSVVRESFLQATQSMLILPETVLTSSRNPPLPALPLISRLLRAPWSVNGRFVEMLPETVCACKSKPRLGGTRTETLPDAVSRYQGDCPPPSAVIDPLAVLACTNPRTFFRTIFPDAVLTRTSPAPASSTITSPLPVEARTFPPMPVAWIFPLPVVARTSFAIEANTICPEPVEACTLPAMLDALMSPEPVDPSNGPEIPSMVWFPDPVFE